VTASEAAVREALEAAGITCSQGEFRALVQQYVAIRRLAEALQDAVYAATEPVLVPDIENPR
jgi:8-oxo-dGTP pyrophosphatase MutT (NUDIX family)